MGFMQSVLVLWAYIHIEAEATRLIFWVEGFRIGLTEGLGNLDFLPCDWHCFLLPFLQTQLSLEMTSICQPSPDSYFFFFFGTSNRTQDPAFARQMLCHWAMLPALQIPFTIHWVIVLPLESLRPFLWLTIPGTGSKPCLLCSQRPPYLVFLPNHTFSCFRKEDSQFTAHFASARYCLLHRKSLHRKNLRSHCSPLPMCEFREFCDLLGTLHVGKTAGVIIRHSDSSLELCPYPICSP